MSSDASLGKLAALADETETQSSASKTESLFVRMTEDRERQTDSLIAFATFGVGVIAATIALRTPAARKLLGEFSHALDGAAPATSIRIPQELSPLRAIVTKTAAPAKLTDSQAAEPVLRVVEAPKPIGPKAVETPFTEHPYLTGKFDEDGVWKPTREYADLSPEAKGIVDVMHNSEFPLIQWSEVDRLSADLTQIVRKFKPVPEHLAEQADNYFVSSSGRVLRAVPAGDAAKIAHERESQIIVVVNDFNRRNHSANIGVHTFDRNATSGNAMAYFNNDTGNIGLTRDDLFRLAKGSSVPDLVGKVTHEAGHGLQAQKVARVVADRLNIDRTVPIESGTLTRFKEGFSEELRGRDVTRDYAQRLLSAWQRDPNPVTMRDKFHVELLLDDMRSNAIPPLHFHDAANNIKHSTRMLNRLSEIGPEATLRELDTHHARFLVFGGEKSVPESLRRMLAAPAGNKTPEAGKTIVDALTDNIDELNRIRQHLWRPYFTRLDEREAWLMQLRAQQKSEEIISGSVKPN